MSLLIANCPRCKSQNTSFDLTDSVRLPSAHWKFESFCVCRHCRRASVFYLEPSSANYIAYLNDHLPENVEGRSANEFVKVVGYLSQKDMSASPPPEHLPADIEAAFREGSACMAISCFNAGATMFRLCVDLATKARLPAGEVAGLTNSIRRSLGNRLVWLFDNHHLPGDLRELSTCIKEDGNDGAHAGTITQHDAQDIEDFTFRLLDRLYSEPHRVKLAQERRAARRAAPAA